MFLSRHRGKLPWIVYKMPWTLNWEGDEEEYLSSGEWGELREILKKNSRKYTQRITREEPSKRKTQERLKRNTQGNRREGKNALWNHGYLIHTLSSTNMQMFFFYIKSNQVVGKTFFLKDVTGFDRLTDGGSSFNPLCHDNTYIFRPVITIYFNVFLRSHEMRKCLITMCWKS